MANLPAKTIAQFVSDYAAAAQASSNTLLDFSVGSIYLALAEASADEAAFLQGLIAYVMTLRWLSSSFGADVDSWTADWMPVVPGTTSPRLPAVAATGIATFSRVQTTVQAVVPVGAAVSTADGSQIFNVYADPTNSAYSNALNGYLCLVGATSVNVPVIAATPGTGGNISAGSLVLLQTAVSFIDSVTNGAPFINGLNAETDAALKARFQLFILSLSKATDAAIGFSIITVQQGLQYTITENLELNGTPDNGYVTIIVDDGSGAISNTLVQAVAASVNLYRAAGIRTGVFPATTLSVTVSMNITTAAGYNHQTLVGQVATAVSNYINGLGLSADNTHGNTLSYIRLGQVAFDASPGVIDVNNLLLNGATADIVATAQQTIKTTSVTVN